MLQTNNARYCDCGKYYPYKKQYEMVKGKRLMKDEDCFSCYLLKNYGTTSVQEATQKRLDEMKKRKMKKGMYFS